MARGKSGGSTFISVENWPAKDSWWLSSIRALDRTAYFSQGSFLTMVFERLERAEEIFGELKVVRESGEAEELDVFGDLKVFGDFAVFGRFACAICTTVEAGIATNSGTFNPRSKSFFRLRVLGPISFLCFSISDGRRSMAVFKKGICKIKNPTVY